MHPNNGGENASIETVHQDEPQTGDSARLAGAFYVLINQNKPNGNYCIPMLRNHSAMRMTASVKTREDALAEEKLRALVFARHSPKGYHLNDPISFKRSVTMKRSKISLFRILPQVRCGAKCHPEENKATQTAFMDTADSALIRCVSAEPSNSSRESQAEVLSDVVMVQASAEAVEAKVQAGIGGDITGLTGLVLHRAVEGWQLGVVKEEEKGLNSIGDCVSKETIGGDDGCGGGTEMERVGEEEEELLQVEEEEKGKRIETIFLNEKNGSGGRGWVGLITVEDRKKEVLGEDVVDVDGREFMAQRMPYSTDVLYKVVTQKKSGCFGWLKGFAYTKKK